MKEEGDPKMLWVNGRQGAGGNAGSRATDLVDLMTAKTAKELGLDLSVKGGAAVKK